MSLPNIVLSSEAHADLLDIEAYIAHQDGEARAEMVIGRLTQGIRSLAFMPGMGRTRPYLGRGIRAYAVTSWIVVYATLPSLDGILVIRVVDGRRDLPRALR